MFAVLFPLYPRHPPLGENTDICIKCHLTALCMQSQLRALSQLSLSATKFELSLQECKYQDWSHFVAWPSFGISCRLQVSGHGNQKLPIIQQPHSEHNHFNKSVTWLPQEKHQNTKPSIKRNGLQYKVERSKPPLVLTSGFNRLKWPCSICQKVVNTGQYESEWSIENSKGRFCAGLRHLYRFYVLSI